jgi:hypothetical protein
MVTQPSEQKPAKPDSQLEKGKLERLAKEIDPPSREIPDKDLKDPGRMTPDAPPADNRS